jgi:hypothetical protein
MLALWWSNGRIVLGIGWAGRFARRHGSNQAVFVALCLSAL